jgi:hypothetical protein
MQVFSASLIVFSGLILKTGISSSPGGVLGCCVGSMTCVMMSRESA